MSQRQWNNVPCKNKPLPPAPSWKSIYMKSSVANIENIFDILQPIGEGAFGPVFKALDKRTNDFVAIKIIPHQDDNYGNTGDFDSDIQKWQQLSSSFIVNFKETYVVENKIWIIMDYCIGSILDMMKVSGNLKEEEIQIVVKELLLSLKYLHSKNILKNEVKADNIMINNPVKYNVETLINGYIRQHCMSHSCWIPPELIPFVIVFYRDNTGTIRLADSPFDEWKYNNSTMIGCPYWMPPETFGRGEWISKSDLWCLGITVFEMATGKPPHADKAPLQVIFLIPRSPSPTLPTEENWSDIFRHFVNLCLIKDPIERPDVDMLLQHEWILNAPAIYELNDWIINAIPLLDKMKDNMREQDISYDYEYDTNNENVYDGNLMLNDWNNDVYVYDDKIKHETVFISNPIVWDKILIWGYCNILHPPIEIINLIISYYGGIINLCDKIICINVANNYVFDSEFCNTLYQQSIGRDTVLTFIWNELVPKDNHVVLTVWKNNFKSTGYAIVYGDKTISFKSSIRSIFEDNDLLDVDFAIPPNASKYEIQQLRNQINDLYDCDVVALEQFYDRQLYILDEKLSTIYAI